MASLAQLFVEFGLDAGDWQKGIRAIQKDAKELEKSFKPMTQTLDQVGKVTTGVGLALSGIGVPFLALAKNAIDAADSLSKMAQRTGASVETLSALSQKAALADVSMSELEGAFRKSSQAIENASSGNKAAAESFKKIGLNIGDLLKMNPDQRFFAIAEGIRNIQDPSIKAGVAMEIWGKSGTELFTMLDSIQGGLSGTVAEARSFNQVISTDAARSAEAFNDALTTLGKAFSGVFNAIAESGLLDVFTRIITTIADMVAGFVAAHPWVTGIGLALAGLAAVVGPLLVVLGLAASGLAALVPIATTVVTAIGAIGAPVIAVVAAITGAITVIASFGAALVALILSNEETRAALMDAWNQIRDAALEVWAEVVAVFGSAAEQISQLWAEHGTTLVQAFTFAMKAIAEAIKNLAGIVSTSLKVISGLIQTFHGVITGDFTKIRQGIEKIWTALWDAIAAVVTRVGKTVIATVNAMTSAVTDKFKAMYDIVVGNSIVPDMMDRIREEFGGLDRDMVQPAKTATEKVAGVFQAMFNRIEDGFRDWKSALKDFGMDVLSEIAGGQGVFDSIKGAIGLGGDSGGRGGGGGGGSVAGLAGSVAGSASPVGAALSIANMGVDLFNKTFGQIGKGREAADQIVKSQEAFVNTVLDIFDDPISGAQKSQLFESLWTDFQAAMSRFAATDPNNQKVVNQAFATLTPFVTDRRRDLLPHLGISTPSGNGGGTINAPFEPVTNITINFEDANISALEVRDVVMPHITDALDANVRGYRERWSQMFTVKSSGTLAPVGI